MPNRVFPLTSTVGGPLPPLRSILSNWLPCHCCYFHSLWRTHTLKSFSATVLFSLPVVKCKVTDRVKILLSRPEICNFRSRPRPDKVTFSNYAWVKVKNWKWVGGARRFHIWTMIFMFAGNFPQMSKGRSFNGFQWRIKIGGMISCIEWLNCALIDGNCEFISGFWRRVRPPVGKTTRGSWPRSGLISFR